MSIFLWIINFNLHPCGNPESQRDEGSWIGERSARLTHLLSVE